MIGIGNPAGVARGGRSGKKQCWGLMQGAMGLGMLGRRQVTPRWANDPVCVHDGRKRIEGQGGCGYPPHPLGGNQEAGR